MQWEKRPSIFTYILGNIDENRFLTKEGQNLPDEEVRFKDAKMRWVPGGIDGTFGHHGTVNNNPDLGKKVAELIEEISRSNKIEHKIELYTILSDDMVMDYIDSALNEIYQLKLYPDPYLYNYSKWLAYESPDRGTVKFGIALLGILQNYEDVKKILILGLQEEFTLFAMVAIENIVQEQEREHYLWEMGKKVNGWGRIHIVERLSGTENPEIMEWLLYEGYKNNIMYEYLAYICVMTGELHIALKQEPIGEKLLLAASDLIIALINGGPAENIDQYSKAAEVIQSYIAHIMNIFNHIEYLNTADSIRSYLEYEHHNWDELSKNGWNKEIAKKIISDVKIYIKNPKWQEITLSKLKSNDNKEFWLGQSAARVLNIDIWNIHWKRLQEKSNESSRWFQVIHRITLERLNKVLEYAMKELPLEKIGTGPADEIGLGKKYNWHSCLDFVVQELKNFPRKGILLILTALKSPVVRNRNMALNALSSWGEENRNDDILNALNKAYEVEPVENVKVRIKKLLQNEEDI